MKKKGTLDSFFKVKKRVDNNSDDEFLIQKRKRSVLSEKDEKSIGKVVDDDEEEEEVERPLKRRKKNSDLKETLPVSFEVKKEEYENELKKYIRDLCRDSSFKYHKYSPFSCSDSVGLESNESIPYGLLCKVLDECSKTTKRLKKITFLTNLYRLILAYHPADLVPALYLSTARIAPPFDENVKKSDLGIGDGLLMKTIAQVSGQKVSSVRSLYNEVGELGDVGERLVRKQKMMFRPKRLTIESVHSSFLRIASLHGKDSQNSKVSMITRLIVASRKGETRFLIRSLKGKLMIGLGEETVLTCLAHAIHTSKKSDEVSRLKDGEELVKYVFNLVPSFDILVPLLIALGLDALKQRCQITPGIPIKPMLAKPLVSVQQLHSRFGNIPFCCEYKYDGERAQIHYFVKETSVKSSIELFSRNLERHTEKYPDILDLFLEKNLFDNNTLHSFIIDAEIVAYERETGKMRPFQVLTTRRKKNVKKENLNVQVCVYAFDILYLNGVSLLEKTLRERRNLLKQNFIFKKGFFEFVVSLDCDNGLNIQKKKEDEEDEKISINEERIMDFLKESVKDGCEGLIVKKLDEKDGSQYVPGKRSFDWVKLKKDYLEGMSDSLDLVPIGAYFGKGKRTGVYGGYLLACYDSQEEEYQAICKIGTGFTEDQLNLFTETLKPFKVEKPKQYYSLTDQVKNAVDVWFEPKVVWEIRAADLSLSPIYTAAIGLVNQQKGIALRFPRFIRVRKDKNPDQATDSEQVAQFYQNQSLVE